MVCHQAGLHCRYSMLRMGLAPCAPFNVTQDLMISAAKLARQHSGVRLHTHLAENIEDIEYMEKTFNCRPGEYIRLAAERDVSICWSKNVDLACFWGYLPDVFLQHIRCTACHKHAAQHSTAQHSTAQHSTAQHSTAQRSAAQHKAVLRSTQSIAQGNMQSTAMHSAL